MLAAGPHPLQLDWGVRDLYERDPLQSLSPLRTFKRLSQMEGVGHHKNSSGTKRYITKYIKVPNRQR